MTGKRERLLAAAKTLYYQQGVYRTTLADVAQAADLTTGNVYYYFRSKDALIAAVIAEHARELKEELAGYEQDPDPRNRLKAVVRNRSAHRDMLVHYGCPYGNLSQELKKAQSALSTDAMGLLRPYIDWAEQQFRLMGKQEESRDLAEDLIVRIQGACLLGFSFHSPVLLERQNIRIEAWLDQL